MKSIEAETKNDGGHRGVLAESNAVENNQGGTNSGDSNQAPHLYYLDRLKKLRAQAGLDKGSVVQASSTTTSGIHSELKFQKKSIFKSTRSTFLTFLIVQKHIFCYFKNGKKSIFAPKNV